MDRIRIVPFKINFKHVKKIDKLLTALLYISVFLGIALLILSKFLDHDKDYYSEKVNYVIGSISLIYFLGDLIKKFMLQLVEQKRRRDFIDNSLNTNLADFKSQGYYSNDDIDSGVYKMGVNCFENSFFSMSISGKMIWKAILTSIVVFLIFICLVMGTDKITVATFLQFALPYSLLQQTIILIIYYFQIGSIFNYFKLLFSSAQDGKKELLLIHNVINYESTLSWSGVILADKLFEKYNDVLSEQWEVIKSEHKIAKTN